VQSLKKSRRQRQPEDGLDERLQLERNLFAKAVRQRSERSESFGAEQSRARAPDESFAERRQEHRNMRPHVDSSKGMDDGGVCDERLCP
jgi:hypothetical protein